MKVFEKQYYVYRRILTFLGLWPYHTSFYSTLHKIGVLGNTIITLVIMGVSVSGPEITLEDYFLTISSCSPLVIFVARYVSFIYNFPFVKFFFGCIQTEDSTLKDSKELAVFTKCIDDSSLLIAIYLYMSCAAIVALTVILFSPLILDLVMPLDKARGRLIYCVGPIFTDKILYVDLITLQYMVTISFAFLAVACTESLLTVISHYACALFKIASYRMRNAIVNATNYGLAATSKDIDTIRYQISLVVNIHKKAIESVEASATAMLIPYLIASILVVISFAFSLHRFVNAIEALNEVTKLAVSVMLVCVHLMYMFLNNYCGQLVINDSLNIFETTYNSTWYAVPLSTQKLLLFAMMKSSFQCSFNLSGLFSPCYVGFSTMMSSSFSYFTMMYSFQQN